MPFLIIFFGLMAISLSAFLIPKILVIAFRKRLFDVPDSRKDHVGAIPRLGGISFYPIIFFCFAFCEAIVISFIAGNAGIIADPSLFIQILLLFCGLILLYLIGITDDLIGVRYRKKFLVQFLVAGFFPLGGLYINDLYGLFGIEAITPWIGIPLTLVFVVFITNAINLIDGIDGLASGLSCIALSVLGIICMVEGDEIYAQLAFATLGVIVPFWFYNVFGNAKRGHKLFMGDTGSLILGYIISLLVIHLSRNDMSEANEEAHSHMVLAFSTLIVPLFDVVRVVIHRLREGKSPFLPDKNHFHHKLLRTGMRPRQVMVTILFIALFFIGINGLLADVLNITILLMLDIVLWTLMQLGINRAIRRRKTTS